MTTSPRKEDARPPFLDLLRLAFLNTKRHKARALANVTGITVAVAALIFLLSFFRGTYEGIMFAAVIDYAASHFQIQSETFDEEDPDSWLGAKALFSASDGDPRDEAQSVSARFLAGRLVSPAYAGDGARKAAVLLLGVDFPREKETFRLAERLKEGEFGSGAVIGAKLAKTLGLEVGDEIRIQARAADGAPNLDYWTVTGIYSAGYPPIDRGMVFLPQQETQEFLGAPGMINKVYVRAADTRAGARASALARERLHGTGLSVRPWQDFAKGLVEDARGDSFFYGIFIAILLFLSLSTVAGTMQVTVFERRREIGMMRACGWLKREIATLFTAEAFAIGLAGAALGCIIGGLVSFLLQAFPVGIAFEMSALDFPEFSLQCRLSAWDFPLAALAGAATALLAGITPARRAARTSILSALSER